MVKILILCLLLFYSDLVNSPIIILHHSPGKIKGIEFTKKELKCFIDNIYHEARGEPHEGQLAVANVVANRYRSGLYPKNLCDIVYQHKQFSWTANKPKINEREVYNKIVYKAIHF